MRILADSDGGVHFRCVIVFSLFEMKLNQGSADTNWCHENVPLTSQLKFVDFRAVFMKSFANSRVSHPSRELDSLPEILNL